MTFHCQDGLSLLRELRGRVFDLIFADTWPGKYDGLELALDLVKPGGRYVIDDMVPQPSWPAGHEEKATSLIAALEQCEDLVVTKLHWSTGIIISTRMKVHRDPA